MKKLFLFLCVIGFNVYGSKDSFLEKNRIVIKFEFSPDALPAEFQEVWQAMVNETGELVTFCEEYPQGKDLNLLYDKILQVVKSLNEKRKQCPQLIKHTIKAGGSWDSALNK